MTGRLRDAADQIPAVALTAFWRSEGRLRALQAGFHMRVAKPVEPAELAVVISSLTTRRAWERGLFVDDPLYTKETNIASGAALCFSILARNPTPLS